MKKLRYLFAALAILLSNIMCAVVAYNYCDLVWAGQYAGFSAPAGTAFLLAIPYGVGIAVCSVLAWVFHRKAQG